MIRKHALAMLQNAPADPLAALEEKYRSKMLQQQHAAAIGSKETTKRSRRIWCFFGEGQGSGKQSFVGYFVSLSALKGSRRFGMIWPSCQVDKKWSCQSCRRICQCAHKISMKKMLNWIVTCRLSGFNMSYFAVPFCSVNLSDFLYVKLLS